MVGTILADYQPKPTCMTLNQPKFHDFSLKTHACGTHTVSLCGTHTVGGRRMAAGGRRRAAARIFWAHTQTTNSFPAYTHTPDIATPRCGGIKLRTVQVLT